ncbi:MAG: BolA/IbaG family iron-sulfur metabolism protein [Candidatus Marinimicrobia bacterium]|nr:BolA/IbaG family iron-sulfur metabolism protein [Candidatus Neomarinimicrobiota bacterium]
MNAKINIQTVSDILKREFPGSVVRVNGKEELDEHYSPGERSGSHIKVEIVTELFRDLPLLEQHKMVHTALENSMQINGGFIHALTIKTRSNK